MDRPHSLPVAAIVGSASLVGRELRDLLAEKRLPARVKLIGAGAEDAGLLTEQAGEAVIMTALDEDNLGEARLVFLAGSAESSRKTLEILTRMGSQAALIDLTSFHEDSPRSRLRAPMVEPPGFEAPPDAIHVIAHPAAIALALFLIRLERAHPVSRAVAHVFEPASERGQRGINELKEQTASLLTFKRVPKRVFDDQLGFNMLARYGSEAPEALEGFESRIERHLATLLAARGGLVAPSLRLIQAPVFHGHSFSVWAEFDQSPQAAALERALASEEIDVRRAGHEAPTAVGMAGQGGIAAGAIQVDRNNPRAAWFWLAADNLRLAAANAVAVARALPAEAR
ncbi:MAG: Asd/ArgC dimerization domain-containing protein [Acidobacteriota bacterium]